MFANKQPKKFVINNYLKKIPIPFAAQIFFGRNFKALTKYDNARSRYKQSYKTKKFNIFFIYLITFSLVLDEKRVSNQMLPSAIKL